MEKELVDYFHEARIDPELPQKVKPVQPVLRDKVRLEGFRFAQDCSSRLLDLTRVLVC